MKEENREEEAEAGGGEAAGEEERGEGGEGGREAEADGRKENLRLTDRDRQLMGMLATVRYLSGEQLRRLLFNERSSINLNKRLLALGGEGRHGLRAPYLKRLTYRSREGVPQSAWTVTKLGFAVAQSVLPAPIEPPAKEPGVDFIEHGLMLNELYVQLLAAPVRAALERARARAQTAERPSRAFHRLKAGLYARADHPGFRWLAHDALRLPWTAYDFRTNKRRNRVILPDATLELLPSPDFAGQRWFLECETGSQSIQAVSDEKRGATVAKLEQYAAFITGSADGDGVSWYARQHPDGYAPRVVFLVHSALRQQHVERAIEEWTARTQSPLKARANTVSRAAEKVLHALRVPVPVPAPPAPSAKRRGIVSAEVRLLRAFHASTMETMRVVRAVAHARGAKAPELPAGSEEVQALLDELRGR